MKQPLVLYPLLFLFVLGWLAGCETIAVHKQVSASDRVRIQRVGIVATVPNLIASYNYDPKSLYSTDLRMNTVIRIEPGVLDGSVAEAVLSRLGPKASVKVLETSNDEKEMIWTNLEGLTSQGKKNALLARLKQFVQAERLDAVVVVRKTYLERLGYNFSGVIHTYRALPTTEYGDHGIMVSVAVDVLDGKDLSSLATESVAEKTNLIKARSSWRIPVPEAESREVGLLIAKEVGEAVAYALSRKGM